MSSKFSSMVGVGWRSEPAGGVAPRQEGSSSESLDGCALRSVFQPLGQQLSVSSVGDDQTGLEGVWYRFEVLPADPSAPARSAGPHRPATSVGGTAGQAAANGGVTPSARPDIALEQMRRLQAGTQLVESALHELARQRAAKKRGDSAESSSGSSRSEGPTSAASPAPTATDWGSMPEEPPTWSDPESLPEGEPWLNAAAPTVAAAQAVPFAAAWEVDQFSWPEVCDRLDVEARESFQQAGEKIRAAAAEGLDMLAITSSRRGEGRTTIALQLARAAARTGVRLALVDADCERPQLAASLGLETDCSWQEVVEGRQKLCDVAVTSLADRMTLFPLAARQLGPRLQLNDPRVTTVLRELAAQFDLVLIDMGPSSRDDTFHFARGADCPVDAVMIVRDARLTSDQQLLATVSRQRALGVRGIGIAENFC